MDEDISMSGERRNSVVAYGVGKPSFIPGISFIGAASMAMDFVSGGA